MTIKFFPSDLRLPSSISGPGLRANTQSGGISPFDGTEQTLALPGARWAAELRWDRLPESEWRKLSAFIASLNGRAGRFFWYPSFFAPRRGNSINSGGSYLQIATTGQTGASITVTGYTGGTHIARIGDFIHWIDDRFRPELHIVTADVPTAGSTAAIPIAPPIRRATVAGAALEVVNPAGVFRMAQDVVMPDFTQRNGPVASFTMPIEEAIW